MAGGSLNLNDPSTFYPYRASVGANAFFMAAFYLMGVIFIVQALRSKAWFVLILAAFALCEAGGYTARLLFALSGISSSVYPEFLAQLIIIIIVPNIVQAYLYAVVSNLIFWADIKPTLTIKKRAKWIPFLFVTLDLICLVIQAIGGAQLANQNLTASGQQQARTIMMAGLGAQVGCLAVFVGVTAWFFFSCPAHQQRQIKWVLVSLATGMLLVVARNIYRMVEFSEGSFTQGALQQNEAYYLVADPMLMLLTCVVFAVVDVGVWLPKDALRANKKSSIAQGQATEAEKAKDDHAIDVSQHDHQPSVTHATDVSHSPTPQQREIIV